MKIKSMPLNIRILLIVFLHVYIICWFYAAQVLHSSQSLILEKSYGAAISGQTALCSNIKTFAESILSLTDGVFYPERTKEIIRNVAASYDRNYFGSAVFCAIHDASGSEIHSNMGDELKDFRQLSPPEDGTILYQLYRAPQRSYVYVSSYLNLQGHLYRVDYAEDITEALDKQLHLARRAFLFLVGISAVLLISLYFSIRRALAPLRELAGQARTMAEGDYSRRVKVGRQDEVGKLAEDFNHMADAVEDRANQLRETAELRELYAANLAHEIKSPMTSIIGYTEIAMMLELEPEKRYELLQYINREGKRLDALSSILLQWSRINHENDIHAHPFKVERMLDHLRKLLQPLLEEHSQALIVQNEIQRINADENLVITVLRNLIANAARASGWGASIELTLVRTDNRTVITVADHGVGIDPAELDRIREPFYMLDKARTRSNQGSGLGLALCDAIVKAHRGRMDIQSKVGSGTTVTVELPEPAE